MGESMIEIKKVSKKFNKITVLDNIDLTINEEDVIGVVGLNGAGKSTLIRMILGLEKPTSGKVKKASLLSADGAVGVMLQEVSAPKKIKVEEWLELVAIFSKAPLSIKRILELTNLTDQKDKLVTHLSQGNQRRLQFGLAVIQNPQLLILDEPTVGMDYLAKLLFWKEVKRLKEEEKMTIILISHDFSEIEAICNRVIILHDHKIKLDREISTAERVDVKEYFDDIIMKEVSDESVS
ncbi:ABC transporter ATP-binding protein [Vagococcus coleopterorum]|uniref:ABC transporter ATP-binding protein n=1 Tax=Vagococcus coleopterorum TaxID=2714946 RepID=A0A6G8ALG7_9ENTE|nr:ABC transporter ATP-binding protein [Vagococcus coleopterorum]QIL45846.1 ABC transporter ATP-binding protein [Vagococcus coleopterorum]